MMNYYKRSHFLSSVGIIFGLLITIYSNAMGRAEVYDDGAWCWFADPRAIHAVDSVHNIDMTYIGYIDNLGNIKAIQMDNNNRLMTKVLIRSYFQPDDHDNPTFLVLNDGRIIVFYSRHTDEKCFYYRITSLPYDLTTLGPERRLETDHNTTYPSPFILSDDPNHIYLCWRGINWHPTIGRLTMPDDEGIIKFDGTPLQIVQSTGARPYAKYLSDGTHRIMMAYTTGHPDNESPNLLYYNYLDINDYCLYDVTDRLVGNINDGPIAVNKTPDFVKDNPMVVDDSPYRDWVWQLAVDESGSPVIAMTRISDDKRSHEYYVARRNEDKWLLTNIAYGGTHFHQSPQIEHCYSGGMAIDPDNTNIVYCSVPVTGTDNSAYEIMCFTTDDYGHVVSSRPITENSDKNNIRPFCIAGTSPSTLIWLNGNYYDWIVSRERPLGYDTRIGGNLTGYTDIYDLTLESSGKSPVNVLYHGVVDFSDPEHSSMPIIMGNIEYVYDQDTMLPSVIINDKKYTSTNVLANSAAWQQSRRATDGKWHPKVQLKRFDLLIYTINNRLVTSINGYVDQSIPLN